MRVTPRRPISLEVDRGVDHRRLEPVARAHPGRHEPGVAERSQQHIAADLDLSFDRAQDGDDSEKCRNPPPERLVDEGVVLLEVRNHQIRAVHVEPSPTTVGTRPGQVRYVGYPFSRSLHARTPRPDTHRMTRNRGSRNPDWIVATASQVCPRASSACSRACMSCCEPPSPSGTCPRRVPNKTRIVLSVQVAVLLSAVVFTRVIRALGASPRASHPRLDWRPLRTTTCSRCSGGKEAFSQASGISRQRALRATNGDDVTSSMSVDRRSSAPVDLRTCGSVLPQVSFTIKQQPLIRIGTGGGAPGGHLPSAISDISFLA